MNARNKVGIATAALMLLITGGTAKADQVVMNFDDLAADGFIGNAVGIYPGDQYASGGILFRTGSLTGAVGIGNTVVLTNPLDSFEILGGFGQPAISPPNFVIPRGGGPSRDLLMSFATPVTSVCITSDNYPETPNLIRLIALGSTAVSDQFTVLAFDEAFDDAISPPANLLCVDRGGAPFSYALFEVTNEQEGFDNLTFTRAGPQTPEPSSLTLVFVGALAGALSLRILIHRRCSQ